MTTEDDKPSVARAVELAVAFQQRAMGYNLAEVADAAKALFFGAVAQIGEDDEEEFLRKCREWFRHAVRQRAEAKKEIQ